MTSPIPMVPETEDGRSVADVLDAAADLLSKPGAWTQGNFALNAQGSVVRPRESDAVCWCAEGAIERVRPYGSSYTTYQAVRRQLGVGFIHEWNDAPERTQEEVVQALREAAQASRQEQQK